MNTTPISTSVGAMERAEQLLVLAGFQFTVVDACPDPGCELCARQRVSAAA